MNLGAVEYKIINKHLMVIRTNKQSSWRAEPNIFETVRAYLLWNYSPDMLPMFPPYIPEYLPELHLWYMHLSKPNPPQTRVYKKEVGEYKAWLHSLDLSTPFDKNDCSEFFKDEVSTKTREVDEIAIVEADND